MGWRILFHPLVSGLIVSLFSGNWSLGFVIAGLTMLIWGLKAGANFIVLVTGGLVYLTGNINLELPFLFVSTLVYVFELLPLDRKDKNLLYAIAALLILLTYQLWSTLLGLIPAQVLNDLNIAGSFLVLAGLIINYQRGTKMEQGNFILLSLPTLLAIRGYWFALPCWFAGEIIMYYLPKRIKDSSLDRYYLFLTALTGVYLLLPVQLYIPSLLIIVMVNIWKRYFSFSALDIIYMSVLMGVIAGRLGFLH